MRRLALLFALAAAPARADKAAVARDAAAWCADREHETFDIDRDGAWTPSARAGEPEPPRYAVAWRGRLDRDRRVDVILDEGGCGTRECMYAAYVQCPDGAYAQVMAPTYAARVRVRGQGRGWARIFVEHVGDLERGRRPRSWSRIDFAADGYVE